jgi:succinyl-diaminopimelate desuccinylase
MATELAARTLALVDVPSESRSEARIAEDVLAAVPLPLAYRDEETLFFETPPRPGRPFVLLAGHLDTVPAQGNLPGRIEDGAVHGLGASDMKGGLAVMIELARHVAKGLEPEVDLGFLFFPREELAADESPLPTLFERCPRVLEAGLVVVLEPTDNTIQAGCTGNLNARLVFRGESAHSARPWLGRNAIDLAVDGLRPLVGIAPRDVEVEGLVFREVLSLTTIHGGIALNVVPDRVEATVNFRYAPTRSPADAEERLRELVPGDLEILSNSPSAHVAARTPLVERLRAAGDFAVEPKQAWTPVAEFAAQGLDAVNLGPGATRHAHRADEQVEIAALERTFEALVRFTVGSV